LFPLSILANSNQCYPSPEKTPHPAKYVYSSPVKSAKKSLLQPCNEEKKGKKRAQLFATSGNAASNDDSGNVEDSFKTLDCNDKLSKLEERFGGMSMLKKDTSKELKILQSNSNAERGKKKGRRSLDSAFDQQRGGKKNDQGKKLPQSNSASSISLADFITPTTKQNKGRKKKGKSMSPVPPSEKISETANETNVPQNEAKEESSPSARPEQDDLWKEIAKSMDKSKNDPPPTIPETPPKRCLMSALVSADPDKIDQRIKLDRFAVLYSFCLDNNLIVNVAAEFYLLCEFLAVQERNVNEAKAMQPSSILNTVHNCVYFACNVLNRQDRLLKFADEATLTLLKESIRIKLFAPGLSKKLEHFLKLSVKRSTKKISLKGAYQSSNVLESVRFHSSQDNVDNFPSDRTFQDFKKQRDLFYEILRSWKSEGFGEGAEERYEGENQKKFDEMFGERMRTLFKIQRHPTNILHLARLFTEQLLNTCLARLW
jgi:hypothetical protein